MKLYLSFIKLFKIFIIFYITTVLGEKTRNSDDAARIQAQNKKLDDRSYEDGAISN